MTEEERIFILVEVIGMRSHNRVQQIVVEYGWIKFHRWMIAAQDLRNIGD